jgi:hypothetical protein
MLSIKGGMIYILLILCLRLSVVYSRSGARTGKTKLGLYSFFSLCRWSWCIVVATGAANLRDKDCGSPRASPRLDMPGLVRSLIKSVMMLYKLMDMMMMVCLVPWFLGL